MLRHALTIRSLGEEVCWLLVHQAMGIPDAKSVTDFMTEKVAVMIFARQSLPERMCVTAAVRQMGGSTMYEGNPGTWQLELNDYQEHLMPIFAYYMDCLYTYGLPVGGWDLLKSHVTFPVINAGSPDAHPAHALADVACMLKAKRYLEGVSCGWLGCANGTLHSLMAATVWFPFTLRVALPPHLEVSPIKAEAERLNAKVEFVATPQEAVDGVDFVFAGCRGGMDSEDMGPWHVDEKLMGLAQKDARLMLSASPVEAIPVDTDVLSGPASWLVRQSEYRLRVHKRLLHWLFE